MKRLILIFLCLTMLTGCSSLVPDSYVSITPHQMAESPAASVDAAEVTDYHSLKVAIVNQIRTGRTEGIIHASNYDGDVEADLKKAAYEASTLSPLGAYAVEYMTHSCSLLVSYYEIRVSITFRRSPQEIAQIKTCSGSEAFRALLTDAVDSFEPRLAVQFSDYKGEAEEAAAMVLEHCMANPHTAVEVPQVSVSVYPESGSSRIVEVTCRYTNNPQGLLAKQRAVETGISAAAEYIRYRQEDYDKVHLLYSYLTQRFRYRQGETVTPLYDALCSGIADPTGLAQAWKLICDRAGVECYFVTGVKNGQPYSWNILRTGSYYRHLDLAQCILTDTGLIMHSDGEMTAYSWDMEQFPACRPLPAAKPEEQPPAEEAVPPEKEDEPSGEEAPSEEQPSEESPAPEETEHPQ